MKYIDFFSNVGDETAIGTRACEVYEMSRIARKPLAIKLTAIPRKDKQLHSATQRLHAAGVTRC